MSIDLFTSNIFSTNISRFLYKEEIRNVYASCRTLEAHIKHEGMFIYTQVCLHHKPHGYSRIEHSDIDDGFDRVIHECHKEGKLHSDNDLPAKIIENYCKMWYKNDMKHRYGDKPAVLYDNGSEEYYVNGKLHRDNDKPATIRLDGTAERWYQNGKLHRDTDLPAIIYQDGSKFLYKFGKKHRDNNKPAVILSDGSSSWYKNGVHIYP